MVLPREATAEDLCCLRLLLCMLQDLQPSASPQTVSKSSLSSAAASAVRASQPPSAHPEYVENYSSRPNELSEEILRAVASVYERMGLRSGRRWATGTGAVVAAGELADVGRNASPRGAPLMGAKVRMSRVASSSPALAVVSSPVSTEILYERNYTADLPFLRNGGQHGVSGQLPPSRGSFGEPDMEADAPNQDMQSKPRWRARVGSHEPSTHATTQESLAVQRAGHAKSNSLDFDAMLGPQGAQPATRPGGSGQRPWQSGGGNTFLGFGLRRGTGGGGSAALSPVEHLDFQQGRVAEPSLEDPYGVLADHPCPNSSAYHHLLSIRSPPTPDQRERADVVALQRYR